MRRALLPALICLATSCQAHAPVRGGAAGGVVDAGFLEAYTATRAFRNGQPTSFALAPDGKAVLFLRSEARSLARTLFELDVSTGEEKVLATAEALLGGGEETLTEEEKARRERQRLVASGIARFELSRDGKRVLVPLSGRLFVIERGSGKTRELTSRAPPAIDARLSPDGGEVAVVRDGDLYVIDVGSGRERRLTTRSGPSVENGLAEFVAQEEMGRFEGFWWSPDGRRIAYQQTDTAGMEDVYLGDAVTPTSAPRATPYPRAGKANARVKLGVIGAGGGRTTWIDWDEKAYPYLATVTWPEKGPLTLVVQDRAQQKELVLAADPGSGRTRTLLEETDAAWLNLDQDVPRWLPDGSAFLWTTERGGTWQLELRDPTGKLLRTVSPPDLGYRGLVDVDGAASTVTVLASADPTQVHVVRLPLDPAAGKPEALTTERGVHHAVFAHDHRTWVHTQGSLDAWPTFEVRTADGKTVAVASKAESPPFVPDLELLELPGDRRLRAMLVRPRGFDGGTSYPVILHVYGGPHHQTVTASRSRYLLDQWMANQGFVVVSIDGRGTPARGRDWERAIRGDLATAALEDQVEGLKALGRRFGFLDLSRVGVTGWSFGGYLAAMAAMRHPDVFAAAVAGAPVTDWADYDTHYTERYLGQPGEGDAYEKSSALAYAPRLSRPLLIIHGTADDNVLFSHSLKLSDALLRAGKDFELLPLPGFTHMVPDPTVAARLQERIVGFLQTSLGRPGDGGAAFGGDEGYDDGDDYR